MTMQVGTTAGNRFNTKSANSLNNSILPRLSRVAGLAFSFTSRLATQASDYASLFRMEGLQAALSGFWGSPERLDTLIHRQSSKTEQGLLELAVNSCEAISGRKIVGRMGEGRLQCLKLIAGKGGNRVELRTKGADGVERGISFFGVERERGDVAVELLEGTSEINGSSGTVIRVVAPLTKEEQKRFTGFLWVKLKYVRQAVVTVNGRRVNDVAEGRTSCRVEIKIDETGFVVRDNGCGMDAESMVKHYLTIGNSVSEGGHSRDYDGKNFPSRIYPKAVASDRARVSFLLDGIEIQGVEVEGRNVLDVGIEVGTGLRLTESKEKVHFRRAEGEIVEKLVEEELAKEGEAKWAVINSLVRALDGVEFDNGERDILLSRLYGMIREKAKNSGEVIFVPDRRGFERLRTERRKIYLDERVFDFDTISAGLEEHGDYKSFGEHRLYLGEFEGEDVVYEEVGKTIILNSRYANNVLLVNLLFNFWVGYGPRPAKRVKIRLLGEKEEVPETDDFGDDPFAARYYQTLLGGGLRLGAAKARLMEIEERRKILERTMATTISPDDVFAFSAVVCKCKHFSFFVECGKNFIVVHRDNNLQDIYMEHYGHFHKISTGWDCVFLIKIVDNRVYVTGRKGGSGEMIALIADGEEKIVSTGWDCISSIEVAGDRVYVRGRKGGNGEMIALIEDGEERIVFTGWDCVKSIRIADADMQRDRKEQKIVALTKDGEEKIVSTGWNDIFSIKIVDNGVYVTGRKGGSGEMIALIADGEEKIVSTGWDCVSSIEVAGDRVYVTGRKGGSGDMIALIEDGEERIVSTEVAGNRVYIRSKNGGQEMMIVLIKDGEEKIVSTGWKDIFSIQIVDNGVYVAGKKGGQKRVDLIEEGTLIATPYLRQTDHCLVHLVSAPPLLDRLPALPDTNSSIKSGDPLILAEHRMANDFKNRRNHQLARLATGDYVEGVSPSLLRYLGRAEIEKLGDNIIGLIEARMESNPSFAFLEIYFEFICRMFYVGGREISAELARRVVERWDCLVEAYEIDEIKDLLDFFDTENLYECLVDGKKFPPGEEGQEWLEYFREKDLSAKVTRINQSEREERGGESKFPVHDLAFYTWAARIHPGWAILAIEKQLALLKKYCEESDRSVVDRRLRGIILGQELKAGSWGRELAQNSRDAGAGRMEVRTALRVVGDRLEHTVVFCDNGRGLSEAEIKEFLLNIEGDNKAGKMRGDGKKMRGGNGIGFKSVFSEADRVIVRSGRIEVEARVKRLQGKLEKVEIVGLREVGFDTKGTEIEVIKEQGESKVRGNQIRGVLCDLFFRRRLKEYVGLMRDMEIILNGERIEDKVLGEEEVSVDGFGRYRLLEVESRRERVIQDGLYVHGRLRDYLEGLPLILREYAGGCVLEVGEEEDLVRGRGELMAESGKRISTVLAVLLMKKAAREQMTGVRPIGGLPQDYLYGQDRELRNGDLEGEIPGYVKADAAAINDGRIADFDIRRYSNGGERELIKLMTLIKVDGQSLQDRRNAVREAAKAAAEGRDSRLELSFEESVAAKKRTRSMAELSTPRIPIEELSDEMRIYRDKVSEVLEKLGLGHIKVGFYSHQNEFTRAFWGWMGWERGIFFRVEVLDSFSPPSYRGLYEWLELVIHEAAHAALDHTDDWTHGADPRIDRSFVWQMRELILTLIRSGYVPLTF